MGSGRQERLAKRYAKALFDVTDPREFDAVEEQLSNFNSAWKISSDFRSALTNPGTSEIDRLAVTDAIAEMLGGWRTQSLGKVLHLIAGLRKLELLPSLLDLFSKYVREYRKSLALTITFSSLPPDEQIADMRTKLSAALGTQVTITAKHNPSLLGGATLRLGDRLLDRSVAGTLGRLADQLRR